MIFPGSLSEPTPHGRAEVATDPDFLTDDGRWAAVVSRDRRADGVFIYAVETTGVYCRPGCASRRPARGNVEFFDDWEAAERTGYRPCKRCRPNTVSPGQHRTRMIARACRRIEAAEEPPRLDALAAEAGFSPWYFHRLFKAAVGVTPKQYASARRLGRFRDGLEKGGTVTEAIYDAGFGSASRAYERVGERLGMTPSDYRSGARGVGIRYAVAPCFLDWVLVATTARGVCAIELGDGPDALLARLEDRFPRARIDAAGPEFSALIAEVTGFIEAPERGLDLPLDIHGTAFQQRVWKAIGDIPPGRTASYAEIARRIGRPNAARAVGRACAANGIAVAIPCHRAVRSDCGIGGYRWGDQRKRALLESEARGLRGVERAR